MNRTAVAFKTPLQDIIIFDTMIMSSDELSDLLLVSQYGIRSHGKVIIHERILKQYEGREVELYLIEKKLPVKNICFIIKGESYPYMSPNTSTSLKARFPGALNFSMKLWKNRPSLNDMAWTKEIARKMLNNNKFLLGQISLRRDLTNYKERIDNTKKQIELAEHDLEDSKKVVEPLAMNIKTIKNMKWIDTMTLESDTNNLILRTKSMACTHVPNISNFLQVEDIKQSSLLYQIMKYQFLGKYFISLPGEYVIPHNFNVVGRKNAKVVDAEASNAISLIKKHLWFAGTACHIGNGNICPGEFASAISAAAQTGLDIFLLNFEAFLRSINLNDAAGRKYFFLPMGNAQGEVEIWPALDKTIKQRRPNLRIQDRSLEGYDRLIEDIGNDIYMDVRVRRDTYSGAGTEEEGLALIKEREPEIYEQIMKLRKERNDA